MIQKPKGTKDLLPEESYKWQEVESKVRKIFDSYNFKEIRVPVFEHTELFQRGVGETTDVVQKEMYTFDDKGGRSITLRPAGTAGAIRAYLENGMSSLPSPIKMWYEMAMYRYENVQKGRLREFHQFGIEIIGTPSYLADVETIMVGLDIFKALNIPDIELNINSIGCPKCRKEYETVLKEFIGKNLDSYCDTCKSRFNKNPLRILDCKEEKCKELNVGAPKMIDYLCDECKAHFENVKNALESNDINYQIDSNIVRGLDYYTKTVFEFVDKKSGLTVLGGGRYDVLVEELGGVPTPAVGFGCGIERLMEMFEENNRGLKDKVPNLYILPMDEKAYSKADELSRTLREKGLVIEKDIMERSFNSQMKYANKIEAKYLLVLGEEEINSNRVKLKDMTSGEEKEISLNSEEIYEIIK